MGGENKSKAPSGVKAVLQYTGIPPSWLDYRPKLPSRNWLIFWTVTSTVTGYYVYDRRECKRIRQAYVDRVSHLAERPLGILEPPRKVRVYGCKWPGDEDYNASIKYFRRYIKVRGAFYELAARVLTPCSPFLSLQASTMTL